MEIENGRTTAKLSLDKAWCQLVKRANVIQWDRLLYHESNVKKNK